MHRLLFVCIHNSARSQMAEAFVNQLCPATCRAESAGLEPGTLNPIVVEAMREIGIDLTGKPTRSVHDVIASKATFTHIITVCDEASAERCPVFPGGGERLHWGFPDPSALTGTRDERLEGTRRIRDAIRERIQAWCQTACKPEVSA